MDRREFLRSAGRTALGLAGLSAFGAACTGGHKPGVATPDIANAARPPTDVDWTRFASDFAGRLIRPGDPGYTTAKQLFDPRFDSLHPAAIAKVQSVSDVQQSIQFARNHGLDFTARSGGHSCECYSRGSGVVGGLRAP